MAKKTWEGSTDGDYSDTTNWKEGAVPAAGNAVLLQGNVAIDAYDDSSTAIDEFIDKLAANIGTDQGELKVDPDSAEFDFSSGTHYVDIGSAAIGPIVRNTASPSSGYGLYLKGSGMTTLTMYGGKVAIAGQLDETATVATVRLLSTGTIYLGPGVSFTTLYLSKGDAILECAATTCTVNSGTLTTQGSGAITTINQYGGTVTTNSTGTVTTYHHYGGLADLVGEGFAKTITTYNQYTNKGNITLRHDENIVTIGTFNVPSTPFQMSVTAI